MRCYAFVVVLAVVVCGALALTDEQKLKTLEYAKDCALETGADAMVILKMKGGDFSDRKPSTQCMAACVLQKAGILDAAGLLQEDVARAKLSQGEDNEQIQKRIDSCLGIKGENKCQYGFNLYECYYKSKN